MQNYKLKIPKNDSSENLTIIYKDSTKNVHELKANKDDFLVSFRYFQKRSNEIILTHPIYIEEDIEFDLFQSFISSITTREIDINNDNYEKILYLSEKYEYEELLKEIKNHINRRPDIHILLKQITQSPNQITQIESDKEELVAKNLDFCIKTGLLNKIPVEILNRILNSPYRQIIDHHLLFSFVISKIKEYTKNTKIDEMIQLNLSMLVGSLDYCLMTNEEIEELFKIDQIEKTFSPRKADEKIQMFIENEKEFNIKIAMLDQKIIENENRYNEKIQKLESGFNEMKVNFEKKFEETRRNYDENIGKQLVELEKSAKMKQSKN